MTSHSSPSWKALEQEAQRQLEQGQATAAAQTLIEAIELEPREPRLYEQLIRITLMGGSTQTAVTASAELRKLDPTNATFAWLQGVSLLAHGSINEAAQVLEEARERSPRSVDVLLALAQVATAQNDNTRATALLEHAVRLDATHVEAVTAYASHLLAAKRAGDARELLLKAAFAHPEDATLQLSLALASLRMGDRPNALLHAEKAVASNDAVIAPQARELVSSLRAR